MLTAGWHYKFDTSDFQRAVISLGHDAASIDMGVIANDIANAVDDLINSEGDGSWPELAPSTILRHPRRSGGMLLQDTGHLAQMEMDSGPDWAEVRSSANYAGFHIDGTKNMPSRDWSDIDLDKLMNDAINEILEDIAK